VQTLSEQIFHLHPPDGLFDDTVIRTLRPGLGPDARRALVHRAVASGEVLRLKPGVYCLAPGLRRSSPHPFAVAAMLHYPSQVSVETALCHHGLLPEAAEQVVSVTADRSRTFVTPLGRFVFIRVPCESLRAGVRVHEVARDAWAFVATPLRAIGDLVYVRKGVTWERDGLRFLLESMRIEPEDLDALSFEDFDEIHDSIRSRRTERYLDGLRRELRA